MLVVAFLRHLGPPTGLGMLGIIYDYKDGYQEAGDQYLKPIIVYEETSSVFEFGFP